MKMLNAFVSILGHAGGQLQMCWHLLTLTHLTAADFSNVPMCSEDHSSNYHSLIWPLHSINHPKWLVLYVPQTSVMPMYRYVMLNTVKDYFCKTKASNDKALFTFEQRCHDGFLLVFVARFWSGTIHFEWSSLCSKNRPKTFMCQILALSQVRLALHVMPRFLYILSYCIWGSVKK